MEFFRKELSDQETFDYYTRIQQRLASNQHVLYSVKKNEDHSFVGYVRLHTDTFDIDFAPAIEIGWRLIPEVWNKGYATEAALACLEHAKTVLKLKELYSFTSLPNKRSERVMQKIGMVKTKEFDHPLVEANHPLLRHVLYKVEF